MRKLFSVAKEPVLLRLVSNFKTICGKFQAVNFHQKLWKY